MLYSFDDYIFEEYLKLDAPLYYSQPLKDTLSALANKGDKVALIGETGSGKTTLLNLISTLIAPTFGKITINNLGELNSRI